MNTHQQSNETLGDRLAQEVLHKLSETIVSLESDEVLQQMRNDQSLYQYKISHIKEVIQNDLDFSHLIDQALQENQALKQEKCQLQSELAHKCEQFAMELDKIQESAKQHTKIKENEMLKVNKHLQKEKQENMELSQQLLVQKELYQKLEKEMSVKQGQLSELRQKLNKKYMEHSQSKKGLEKVHTVLQKYESDHEETINMMQNSFKKQTQEYQNIIAKMQNDMSVIKGQWQKKCIQIQNQLRSSYKEQLLSLQDKKNRQMQMYIQNCKDGKPIIIKEDSQLLNSKLEVITQQYEAQLSQLQEKCTRLSIQNVQLQNQLNKKNKHSYLQDQKRKLEYKGLQQQLGMLEQDRDMIRQQNGRIKKENQIQKHRIQQHNKRVKEYQIQEDQLKSQIKDNQIEIEKLKGEKERMKKDIENNKHKMSAYIKENRETKLQSETIESENNKLKDQAKYMEKKQQINNRHLQELKEQLGSRNREFKEQVQEIGQLKNINKSNNKQIQQYKHEIQELNKKIQEQDNRYKEIQKKHKEKLQEMINQFEKINNKDHEQFQVLERENQRMRRQLKRMEIIVEEKNREVQIVRENTTNSEIQEVKRICLTQITNERHKYQILSEDYERKERQHHIILQQTKNQIKDTVKLSFNKWQYQLCRLEEQNKKKDKQLLSVSQKLQLIVSQYEDIKKNQEYDHEDAKKMRKRYQILKAQKQQKIQDLLKRLQQQSKHKIALEKELKMIRNQVNKMQPMNMHTHKPIDAYTSERENKYNPNTDREKELSQIRELISKTYKVVGQKPQSDQKWKKLH